MWHTEAWWYPGPFSRRAEGFLEAQAAPQLHLAEAEPVGQSLVRGLLPRLAATLPEPQIVWDPSTKHPRPPAGGAVLRPRTAGRKAEQTSRPLGADI